jgi:hypothetical protein
MIYHKILTFCCRHKPVQQGAWLSDALQQACHSGKVKMFIV